MNKFVKSLFLFCVFITTTNPSFSEEDVVQSHLPTHELGQEISVDKEINIKKLLSLQNEHYIGGRSRKYTEEINPNFNLSSKPMKEFVSDIFKIYKSTYLGNKTYAHYKQELMDKFRQQQQLKMEQEEADDETINEENESTTDRESNDDTDNVVEDVDEEDKVEQAITIRTTIVPPQPQPQPTPPPPSPLPLKQETKIKLSPNKKSKHETRKTKANEKQYNVGPALNLSLDMSNNIVKVNLDGESLKELVTGRWLNDNTEQGRGKKYEMVTRILPLFILPFLIQSAIVPFLVTKLKLLLMKSILVGKLAIFLLIISAFRNSNKQMQTYEVAPSYWAGEPSRRSELAAAASNMAYNGYRVEGKPAAWVN